MPPPMSKLTSLHDAIAAHVHDGDLIYAAGFTHLIPFAAGHEIIRQGRRQLVLARATPDLIYDQMVAAGCARKIIFSYSGNPGIGSLRIVRTALEAGTLEWEEYSHFAMISRLTAGASGVPFMPMNPTGVDDLPKANPSYRTVTDPYSGRLVVTVPALHPDVAIVHVQRADAEGNCHLWGILGEQKEAAFAAARVIVTAEEIVDSAVIPSAPHRTTRQRPRRGERRCGRQPLGPEPHAHPRPGRRRRLPRPLLRPPLLHPGLLRPGQRLLPRVGSSLRRTGPGPGLARRVGLRPPRSAGLLGEAGG